MLETLVGIVLVLLPVIFFTALIVFSQMGDDDGTPKIRNRGLCSSPNCVRCMKNKQAFSIGLKHFQTNYAEKPTLARLKAAMRASVSEQEELFLNMDLGEASPIWDRARLSTDIREDLAELEDNYDMILDNCQKALNCAYLWKRNEELTSTWFVFPLINQGVWQEAQCRVCSDLVKLLHKLDSLLVDCVFGNVFISMLPANASISEHRGMTNVRLRCHYGVEVPKDTENCYMMVGDEKFNWEDGRCVVIDDSYKHSVVSKGCKEDRIVLVLDLWHPNLTKVEKECLCRIFPAPEV